MRNYVFIAEFKNHIYVNQYKAENEDVAFLMWIHSFVSLPTVSNLQRRDIILEYQDKDNQPFLIEELSNVWRWGAMAWGKFLSVEYMETVSMETEDYPYLYTFILYLAGGTYISQHCGESIEDAYNSWHSYFLQTQYANDTLKEKLKGYSVDSVLPFMEMSEFLCRLFLDINDTSFELFITKVRLG